MTGLTRPRSLAAILTLAAGVALTACAGRDPTRLAAYQALEDGFQAVKMDADLGRLARANHATADLLHVAPISPSMADFSNETAVYHETLIQWLRKRELGTITPQEPMPPGPTMRRIPPPPQ